MNKSLKLAIIVVSILLGLTIVGIFATSYLSEKREQERLEAERIAVEKELERQEEEFNTFLSENKAFYPGSYLNDIDISNMTPAEVIYTYEKDFENEKLIIHVEDTDVEQTLTLEALDLDFDNFDKYVNDCYKKQQITKEEYFGESIRKDYSYDFLSDLDMEKFVETDLFSFFSDNVAKSSDAHVMVDSKTGEVSIEPEVYGNEISFEVLKEKMSEALGKGEYEITVTSNDYVKPQILSDDKSLSDKKSKLEKIVNKEISIKLCGEKTSLSKEGLWKILDGSDDYVSDKALDDYIKSLKAKYDSCYFNRSFTTSYGDEITLDSGNYGWVIDSEKTKSIFTTAIGSSNSTPSIEVAYSRYGQRPALHEMTNTYIEVSISSQHMWVYVDGECLLSDDIISGEVTTNDPETTTNRGVFRLSYKQHKAILRGADYEEPVTYWMPFDGGIGFHDATWREDSEFGGETYMGNGSHGCVNMRLASAEQLFNIIDEEIMIIVW